MTGGRELAVFDGVVRGVGVRLRFVHEVFYFPHLVNGCRHCLFRPPVTRGNLPVYYCLFKRDFFMSFSKVFAGFVDKNPLFAGVGESINKSVFERLVSLDVDWLLFVYESGAVYRVSVGVLERFFERFPLERVQVGGEVTLSFPVSLLERWGDV